MSFIIGLLIGGLTGYFGRDKIEALIQSWRDMGE